MSSRVLRQGFVSSEPVNQLHDKTFRLYLHLIAAADDYGLVEVSFPSIRCAAPLQSWSREEVAKMLGELTDARLINPYEADGRNLAAVAKWQAVIRSGRPRLAVPPWGLTHCMRPTGYKDSTTRAAALSILTHIPRDPPRDLPRDAPEVPLDPPEGYSGQEGVKVKRKEKEKERPNDLSFSNEQGAPGGTPEVETDPSIAKLGTRLANPFSLPAEWSAWAMDFATSQGKNVTLPQIQLVADKFADYWHAKPGKDARKLDWLATWRNWFRNSREFSLLPLSSTTATSRPAFDRSI